MLESSAICLYLADLCGRLAPEIKDRAEYYNWMMYSACRMDEALDTLSYQWDGRAEEAQDKEALAKAKTCAELCFDNVEATLNNRKFILGDELSAADCVLGFNVHWASGSDMKNGLLLKGRPNTQAYLQRLMARPAFQAAMSLPGPQ